MMPHPSARTFLLAGLSGELAFEAYAWLVSPILFGVTLEPANLVTALASIFLGLSLPYWAAFLLHFTIGTLGFAAMVLVTQRLTRANLVLSGVLTGLALWVVAQGFLAQAVGRPFMMGFGVYTQSSFVGHVGMTTLIGLVLHRRGVTQASAMGARVTG